MPGQRFSSFVARDDIIGFEFIEIPLLDPESFAMTTALLAKKLVNLNKEKESN
jgi:hypothetical protein